MPRPFGLRGGRIWSDNVEVNVVYHCNLACKACNHFSPIARATFVEADDVARDFRLLAQSYRAKSVKVIGGEPLLHPRLLDIVAALRRSDIAKEVQLATNGTLLAKAPDEVWRAFTSITVSSYDGFELTGDARRASEERASRLGVRFEVFDRPQFRQSHAERGTADPALRAKIYETCGIAHVYHSHTVAEGLFYKCPQAFFLPRNLGPEPGHTAEADGLPLASGPAFRDELLAYLNSPAPLNTCGRCLGTAGRRFTHHQSSRRDWSQGHEGAAEGLVDPESLRLRPLPGRVQRLRWRGRGLLRRLHLAP
jgi:organic radical activating enzyme